MKKNAKTLLIIGASSGIGEAVAYVAAKQGYQLAITARRVDLLDNIAKKIECQSGARVLVRKIDVLNNTQALYDSIKEIAIEMDGIDCIMINSGVISERKLGTLDISKDATIINTNLTGAISVADAATKLFLEQPQLKLRKQRGGHIVVTSSMSAIVPLPTSPVYAATKAAVSHYFEGIRGRLGKRNIALTVLHPGFIQTVMTEKLEDTVLRFFVADVNQTAKDIVYAIKHEKEVAMIPANPWRVVSAMYHLTPTFMKRKLAKYL